MNSFSSSSFEMLRYISLKHRLAASLLLLLLPIHIQNASCNLYSSTSEVAFFDRLRLLSPNHVRSKTLQGSSVVEVILPKANQTHGESANDQSSAITYRLCHLTSILPVSQGNGQPKGQFGIFSNRAAFLAMYHFNNKISKVVPDLNARIGDCNVRLTMEYRDSDSSPIQANRVLIKDLLSRNHSLVTPKPIALVGASRWAVSSALSITASASSLPVISPISLSSELNNKDIYGMFGRTNPGSAGASWAAVSYLVDVVKTDHCSILFVKDKFGIATHSDFIQAANVHDPPLKTVSAAFDSNGNRESIEFAMAQVAASGIRCIFCIANSPSFPEIVRAARKIGIIGDHYFWLFSHDLIRFQDFRSKESGVAKALQGMTFLHFDFKHNKDFEESWATLEQDTMLKEYFIAKQPGFLDLSNFSIPSRPSMWEYTTYDAVVALGIAACKSQDYFFDGASLFQAFLNTSFIGASGAVEFEESTGSRDPTSMQYIISNVVANEASENGFFTFTVRPVARQVKHNRKGKDGGDFTPTWMVTNETLFADGRTEPPTMLPPKRERRHMITARAVALGLTLAGLTMAMSLLCGTWAIINRNTHVVRLSQLNFLIILCVGTFVMASTVIPMSIQEPANKTVRDVACMSVPWLFSIGFVLTFSALFSKTAKVNKLFSISRRLKRIRLKAKEFMLPFILLLTSTVILLISWTIVAPLRWQRLYVANFVDSFGRKVESYPVCIPDNGTSVWVFVVLLGTIDAVSLAFAVYQNYRARNVITAYNESHYISISVLCILQSCAVGLLVLVAAYPDPTSVFVIGAILVSVICAAVLLPLFIPKEIERRKEIMLKCAERVQHSSQSKLEREWQVWFDLTLRNKALQKELDNLKSSRRRSSSEVVDESLIYYGSLNSIIRYWKGEGDESSGTSQVQQSWIEG